MCLFQPLRHDRLLLRLVHRHDPQLKISIPIKPTKILNPGKQLEALTAPWGPELNKPNVAIRIRMQSLQRIRGYRIERDRLRIQLFHESHINLMGGVKAFHFQEVTADLSEAYSPE